jgi:hypothetical protein
MSSNCAPVNVAVPIDDSSPIAPRRIGHARTATATVTATGRWRETGKVGFTHRAGFRSFA